MSNLGANSLKPAVETPGYSTRAQVGVVGLPHDPTFVEQPAPSEVQELVNIDDEGSLYKMCDIMI